MTAVRISMANPENDATLAVEVIGDHGAIIARGVVQESQVIGLTTGTYDAIQVDVTADGLPGDPSPLSVSGPLTPRPLGAAGAPVELPDATPRCRWYAMCENPPAGWIDHPVMGPVPACQRCADKHGFTLLDQEP